MGTLICFANGTGLLGGANEVTNSEDRTSYANKALEQLERSSNSINARKIVEVTKVESQVVAGIKYTVHFKLAVTECLKDTEIDEANEEDREQLPLLGKNLINRGKRSPNEF